MVCFVSGHRNITHEQFTEHYEKRLLDAHQQGASFVVGDCVGVDSIAQSFLKYIGCTDVTVYHMFEEPRYNAGYKTIGGFKSDVERDHAMTLVSDVDIAWIDIGRERSGTGQNLERRKWVAERKTKGLPYDYEHIQQREAGNFI